MRDSSQNESLTVASGSTSTGVQRSQSIPKPELKNRRVEPVLPKPVNTDERQEILSNSLQQRVKISNDSLDREANLSQALVAFHTAKLAEIDESFISALNEASQTRTQQWVERSEADNRAMDAELNEMFKGYPGFPL